MDSRYHWLRNKRPSHIEKLRVAALGNQNAKTHGKFSRTPPGLICDRRPNIRTCPSYRSGNACIFLWQEVAKMEKEAQSLMGAMKGPNAERGHTWSCSNPFFIAVSLAGNACG